MTSLINIRPEAQHPGLNNLQPTLITCRTLKQLFKDVLIKGYILHQIFKMATVVLVESLLNEKYLLETNLL